MPEKRPRLSAQGRKVERQFCAMQLIYGFVWASTTFFTVFLKSTGMSPQQVGLCMSLNSLAGVLAPPIWGLIADKIGSRKRLWLWLLVISGAGFALIPASGAVNIAGITLVTFVLPAVTFVRQPTNSILDTMIVSTAEQYEGMSYSSIRRWSSLGFALLSPVYGWLIPVWGIGFPFYMFLFFSLLTAWLGRKLPDVSQHAPAAQATEVPRQALHISRIFKDYYLVVFLIFNVLLSFGSQTYYFLNYLIEELHGNAESLMGVMSGLKTIAEITMLSLSPILARRLSLPQMLCLSGLFYGSEQILYLFGHSISYLFAVQMLNGAGFGTLLGSAVDYAYSLAPKGLETTVTSLYGAGMGIAGIIANAFAGWAIATLGVRWMYGMTGVLIFAAIALFVFSFPFGKHVLKKQPPTELFKQRCCSPPF